MRKVIVIGNGISGMSCAVKLAEAGLHVLLVSVYPSERSQSVMAAGGINAVLADCAEGDSVSCHIEDTLAGGGMLAGREAVAGLCRHAEEIILYLKRIGTVFTVDEKGHPVRRAFGAQSFRRTCYCGTSTGKQIVSALVMETRRLESAGFIQRRTGTCFHSALIRDGVCHGALLYDDAAKKLYPEYADALVMATGGQNALFGKTTGSTLCDGYAAGKLFLQGAALKNLEFIQYHPTTLETSQKRMLLSEAVRGEGGRLFYLDQGKRVYFMEDKYGPRGNLMSRDLVSREICAAGKDVFLDISFLDSRSIDRKLPEVRDLCMKYRGIDISREPIPVVPSVHFFMGGLAVHMNHETNIRNLFAVGECASMYHGANRLGGNSLLAALYSGMVAAREISGREISGKKKDFKPYLEEEDRKLRKMAGSRSRFPVMYIRDMAAGTMEKKLAILRDRASLEEGISEMDYYLSVAGRISYDSSVFMYTNYSLQAILTLGRAALVCARERRESRGAHFRTDYPESREDYAYASIISYDRGRYQVQLDKEFVYES